MTHDEMIIDLHTHSTFSDGTLTPLELVSAARLAGLSAIALTDHNTVAGLPDFFAAGGDGITLIGGVEFSTDWRGEELHIIALGVKEEHYGVISDFVGDMRRRKERATEELIDNLIAAGYNIDREMIWRGANGTINRAHVATELIRCGYVKTREEAFASLLWKGGGYYFEPSYPDALGVIGFIRSLGLLSVLAHPLFNIDEGMLAEFLAEATPLGLDAMEVIYSEYSDSDTECAARLATEFGLLFSGGSDFHGDNKIDIKIGVGKGNLKIPLEFADKMKLI